MSWQTIFAIAPDCHATVGHYSTLWRRHFYEGIPSAGLNVVVPEDIDFSWSYDKNLATQHQKENRARCCEILRSQILRALEDDQLDAVLSYARSNQIEPDLVREVEKAGIPWINFFCDSVGQFESVRELASVSTLNWFPESESIPSYAALGRPFLCRPYAYTPAHLPPLRRSPIHDLGFAGLPTANRVTMLGTLLLLGCKCRIHGPGWNDASAAAFSNTETRWQKLLRFIREPDKAERLLRRIAWPLVRRHAHGPLTDEELLRFLAECRIVLGLNESRTADGSLSSYLKFRDLEMPGYGCCYLTQDNPDIRTALEPDKEVLTFSSPLEARNKVKYYSAHPELAAKIGDAGRTRVLKEHSWSTRLQEIRRALI